jgi:hypothetical protein
VLFKANQQKQ